MLLESFSRASGGMPRNVVHYSAIRSPNTRTYTFHFHQHFGGESGFIRRMVAIPVPPIPKASNHRLQQIQNALARAAAKAAKII